MRPDNILTISYLEKHPTEAARVLENFPYTMSARLLEQLPPDKYTSAFLFLMPSYAANLLLTLGERNRAALAGELPGEKFAALLACLNGDDREDVLGHLPSDKRASVIRHMQYPLESVGTIMGPPSFSLPDDITAAEALKRIKHSRKKYPLELFIVNRSQQYIGSVTLDRLIKASATTRLGAITDTSVRAFLTRNSLGSLANDPAWSNSLMLPVVDSRGVLAGVLENATLQQHLRSETPVMKPREKVQVSVLELIFQTLAILLEGVTSHLLPSAQRSDARNKSHDNVV